MSGTGSGTAPRHPAKRQYHAHDRACGRQHRVVDVDRLVGGVGELEPAAEHDAGDAARGEQAQVGAVGDAERAPAGARARPRGARHGADERMVRRSVSAGANCPPVQAISPPGGPSGPPRPRLELRPGLDDRLADPNADAALERQQVGYLARPRARPDPADEQRVGELRSRISGWRRRVDARLVRGSAWWTGT